MTRIRPEVTENQPMTGSHHKSAGIDWKSNERPEWNGPEIDRKWSDISEKSLNCYATNHWNRLHVVFPIFLYDIMSIYNDWINYYIYGIDRNIILYVVIGENDDNANTHIIYVYIEWYSSPMLRDAFLPITAQDCMRIFYLAK